jgi:DNA-binding LytR/AlgR family response regulator
VKLKCIIVEDELLAQDVLENHISSLDSLLLVKKCNNAIEALNYLHRNPVDLIFLDIEMPELTGLDFLETLDHRPKIIITSAYSKYALDGYEYSVTDYLLKPISFEKFIKAVNKVLNPVKDSSLMPLHSKIKESDDFIFLQEGKIDHKVFLSDIKYIEAYRNYLKVHTKNKMILVYDTLKKMEEQLPDNLFLRVHKSFLISLKKITRIEGNIIYIGDKIITIGKYYKIHVHKILNEFKLKK